MLAQMLNLRASHEVCQVLSPPGQCVSVVFLIHHRLKKKEFSLEEIYTNKNFSKPPER